MEALVDRIHQISVDSHGHLFPAEVKDKIKIKSFPAEVKDEIKIKSFPAEVKDEIFPRPPLKVGLEASVINKKDNAHK